MSFIDNIKDVASIAQKADNIELYKKILDIQANALEMQEEIYKLKEENRELRKVKDLEEEIEIHQSEEIGSYITLKHDKNKIKYCVTCWGTQQKLIPFIFGSCSACAIAYSRNK